MFDGLVLFGSFFQCMAYFLSGTFVITEGTADQNYASKVKTTIVQLLSLDHIKDLKKMDKWYVCNVCLSASSRVLILLMCCIFHVLFVFVLYECALGL